MFARRLTLCMNCRCWRGVKSMQADGPTEDAFGECCRRAPTLLYVQAHEDDRPGACSALDEQALWPGTFGGQGCFDGFPLGWRVRVGRWIRGLMGKRPVFGPRAKLVDRVWSCDRHPLSSVR